MGCCGRSRKAPQFRSEQRWEYINLNDFKSKGCLTHLAYGYLWFSLLLSTAVYAVDTFTAVNLLALNNWTSKIKPDIDLDISKWVFSICIILSFINVCFEHIRAWRVMGRGNIAECYLDSLAVRLESTRLGKRQGYRRFLVFAELTKSKKGTEYIALFTYFNLKSWVRVLICSGPRQVINAFTIKALYVADLNPNSQSVEGSFVGFFENLKTLATEDYQKALVLIGMGFTLIIWIFSLIFLILAVLAYVFFLWHWIPRADGGLAGYCGRKVNKTLMRIVTKKVNKALKVEEEKRIKEARKNRPGEIQPVDRKATLPTIPNVGSGKMSEGLAKMPTIPDLDAKPTLPNLDAKPTLPNLDAKPTLPNLERKDTMQSVSTLPPYSAKNSDIELNRMGQRPDPSRTHTMATNKIAYSANSSLLNNAQDMGAISPIDKRGRSDTGLSGYSIANNMSQPLPSAAAYAMGRQNTGTSGFNRNQTQSPSSPYNGGPPRRPPVPGATMDYNRSQSPAPPMAGSQYQMRQQTYNNGPAPNRQPTLPQLGDMNMARTQSPSPFGQPMPNRQPTLPTLGKNMNRSQPPAPFGQQPPNRQPTLPQLGNPNMSIRSQSPAVFDQPTRQPTLPNILPEPTLPNLLPEPTLPNLLLPEPTIPELASSDMFRSASPSPYGQTAAQPTRNFTPFTPFNPNTPSTGIAELGSGSPPPRPSRSATAQSRGLSPSNSEDGPARSNTSPYDIFASGDGRNSPAPSVRSNGGGGLLRLPELGFGDSASTPAAAPAAANNGGFKPFTPQRSATAVPNSNNLSPSPLTPQRNMTAPISSNGYAGSDYGSEYFSDYRQSTQSSAFDLEHYDVERQQDRRQ